ncbi:MAG: helix-turn-helix domain-containing protein [Limimaricola soesokkakensis]|uniref:helix-turn-helix domain-containing protein n=1 Tax=Limimaricola soesokkakensis TaxID=1343159 RepID=UPI0040598E12
MDVMQCRAARAMLSLGVRELAALAGVSPDTVARLERGATLKPVTVERIRAALEAQGIVFLDPGDRAPGPGLSLEPPPGQEGTAD